MKAIYLYCTILIVLISGTSQLHIHQADRDNILNTFSEQQDTLKQNTGKLNEMINQTNSKMSVEKELLSKIKIIQDAIINEENQVNLLSRNLVPTIKFSPTYCSSLTDEDKSSLTQLSSNTINKLNQLTKTLNNMDSNDLRVIQMKQDASNQIFYLENVKNLLSGSCESQTILSPTVFQSNIYAPNWLLGNQTMNQFIATYIQRSINYQNITNCPVQFPFFNGKKCINCFDQTPLFNMKTLTCEACKKLQTFDQTKKQCINSTIYLNNIFSDKPWVTNTGNLTEVLEQNIQTYQANSTNMSGRYQYCGSDKPFVVNGLCSACQSGQIFVFQSAKCQNAPNDKLYDQNTHSFLQQMKYFQTNPIAKNIITIAPLSDSPAKPNCPTQTPYYDGIACIICPFPFNLFDNDQQKCLSCNPQQYYNSEKQSCQLRPIVYEGNKDKNNILIGTPNFKVEDFLKNISLATTNKDAIVAKCSETQISNFSNCVSCSNGQYFNVASKKCVKCQNVDLMAKICWDNVNIKPANSSIDSLVGSKPGDVNNYLQTLNGTNSIDTLVCNQTTPFPKDSSCVSCPNKQPLFNISSNQCTKCDQYLNVSTHVCQPKVTKFLPNPTINANYTGSNASSIDLYLSSFKKDSTGKFKFQTCSEKTPYSNFDKCLACSKPTFIFNVTSLICVQCPQDGVYDQKTSTCINCQVGFIFNTTVQACKPICINNTVYNVTSKKCVNKIYLSSSEENIVGQTTKQVEKYFANQTDLLNNNPLAVQCDSKTPYSTDYSCISCNSPNNLFNITSKQCTSCPSNQYYNSTVFLCVQCQKDSIYDKKTGSCIRCQVGFVFNITAGSCKAICLNDSVYNATTKNCDKKFYLSATQQNIVGQTNKQVQNYFVNQTNLQKNSPLAVKCNASAPYSIDYACISCKAPNNLFNISSKKCSSCPSDQYYSSSNFTCNSCPSQQAVNPATLKCQLKCPNKDTKWDGKNCVPNCTIKQFYNTSLKACQDYQKYTFQKVSNLQADNWVAQNPEATLNQIKNKLQQNATSCSQDLPFFDGKKCIKCLEGEVFFMDTQVCNQCPVGSLFNVYDHVCRGKQDFITNVDSENLIFDGFSYGELSYYYNQNKTTYPDIKDCQDPTPYFNSKKCISCPEQTPYFNIVYRNCMNCPQGSTYDSDKRQCINQVGEVVEQNPSLAKLVASIFAHKHNFIQKQLHRLDRTA